jgi:DNA-binding CsgD family transcriptional regulator
MTLQFLKKLKDTNYLLELVRVLWSKFYEDDPNIEPPLENIDTMLFEKMSRDKHTVFAIFNLVDLKINYIGKNAEDFCGYPQQEFIEKDFLLIFKIFKFEHLLFFIKVLKWAKYLIEHSDIESAREFNVFNICGLTIKHKTGREIKLFMRVHPTEISDKGNFNQVIVEMMDVTSLLKMNDYWIYSTIGKTNPINRTFYSTDEEKNSIDLISPRELEILELIAVGLSSKQIGELLFISSATVDKHRKNMIARVGVIDTLALVEICKRCGIL